MDHIDAVMLKDALNFTFNYQESLPQILNESCDWNPAPSAVDYIDSLGFYGVGLIGIGSLLTVITFYLIIDAVYNVILQNETTEYKTNCFFVLSIYPVASFCSLLATAIPRTQLLSESLTQICLMVSLYRLFLLLIDLGHRSVSKPPSMALNVGPCCCWPCLPFPKTEMNNSNIAWLRLCVLQLPIVQGLIYCALLVLDTEKPIIAQSYGPYLQPMVLISILFGLYGLTVVTKTLQDCAPEAAIPRRTIVSQMVLLCSKLQGFIIKNLCPNAGVFPCYPPLTPQIYANLTYNILMLIEMLMLACAARKIYMKTEKYEDASITETNVLKNNVGQTEVTGNIELPNIQLPVPITALTTNDVNSRMP